MSTGAVPGALFAGRYEIVRPLASGGMGTLYEVIHRETRRKRALKVMLGELLTNEDMRSRFLREAQVTADVRSENIVETFDAGIDEATGQPFLVMELLEGEDLSRRLARERIPIDEVMQMMTQAARGLDKTHAANIVHRDLKPENLFQTAREDGSLLIKILDFGIAKALSDVKQSTAALGTPLYIAPEALERNVNLTAAVDRYALGHIGYALVVGEPYFETESREVATVFGLLNLIGKGPLEPASVRAKKHGVNLALPFDAWFEKAVHVDPKQRFKTNKELVEELCSILKAHPPTYSVIDRSGEDAIYAPTIRAHDAATKTRVDRNTAAAISSQNKSVAKDFAAEIAPHQATGGRRLLLLGASVFVLAGAAAASFFLFTGKSGSASGNETPSRTSADVEASRKNDATTRDPKNGTMEVTPSGAVLPANTGAPTPSATVSVAPSASAAPSVLAPPLGTGKPFVGAPPGPGPGPGPKPAGPNCDATPWLCR